MSVMAEIGGNKVPAVHKFCPSLDILGINSYGGAESLPERYRQAGGTKPYIVTEFGPPGPWEVQRTEFGAVIELNSNAKAIQYEKSYNAIVADKRTCLGSYAFLWGQKQEATPTWFGMFLKDGRKTNSVDVMTKQWSGRNPDNLCPKIDSLELKSVGSQGDIHPGDLRPGQILEFRLDAMDPEGEPLDAEWFVAPEAEKYITNGEHQAELEPIPGAVPKSNTESAIVIAPEKPGIYRLYVQVDDPQHAAATANFPFRVKE
jgi:hypothetical protein